MKSLDGCRHYYQSNDRHLYKQNESKAENPKIKYITMLFLLPDSVVQWAVDVNVHSIQSQWSKSVNGKVGFCSLGLCQWTENTNKQESSRCLAQKQGHVAQPLCFQTQADHVSANVYRLVCV